SSFHRFAVTMIVRGTFLRLYRSWDGVGVSCLRRSRRLRGGRSRMARCIEVTATSFAIAMALAGSAQATPAETRGAVGVPGLIACSQAALATGIEAANVVDTGVIELPPGCTITLDGT